jgi:hypothetical protein
MAADLGKGDDEEQTVEEIPPEDRHGMFVAHNLETGKTAIVEIDSEKDADTGKIKNFIRMMGEHGGNN